MPSSYEYKPLSSPTTQIRLLELLPGRGTIQCRLKVVDLQEAEGTYEPISYCWKSHTSKHWGAWTYKYKKKQRMFRIRIDGAGLYITESLRDALKQMRLKTKVRLLWADAICINQANNDEKNHQVAMMGEIYESGKHTLAWIGNADCWTGRAFRHLQAEPSVDLEASDSTEIFEDPVPQLSDSKSKSRATNHHSKSRGGIRKRCHDRLSYIAYSSLLSRPYFSRGWIYQELVLSDDIVFMCGDHETTWCELYEGHRRGGVIYRSWAQLIDGTIADLLYDRELYDLDAILSRLSHTKTSDPRDKIYSALGLDEHHTDGESMRIDYSKDVDEVFLEATKMLLSRSPSLNLLSMSNCTKRSEGKHVPSWVWSPDSGSTEFHLSWAGSDRKTPFNASKGWHPQPQFRNRMLGLRGYVFDNVEEVGRYLPEHKQLFFTQEFVLEAFRCYCSWIEVSRMYEQGISEAETKRSMRDFRCTLTPLAEANDSPGLWYSNWHDAEEEEDFQLFHGEITRRFSRFLSPGTSDASFRKALASWSAEWWWSLRLTWLSFLHSSPAFLRFVYNGAFEFVFNRCFVRTEDGDYGLCPPDTKPNDRLVLLQGANVPIVLRPSGKNWILVGECYIYGVMYGELWDQDRCEMLWIE